MSDTNRIPVNQDFLDKQGLRLEPMPKEGTVDKISAGLMRHLMTESLHHGNAERLIKAAAALVEARKDDQTPEMAALRDGLAFYRNAVEQTERNAAE